MKNKSIWLDDINFDNIKPLEEDTSVDVLIIGGGITGLSTAYHLINSKLKVCVVDKGIIGNGVTGRTTGKLTYLQDNVYTKLKEKGKLYYNSQLEAIEIVSKIIKDNNINCNLEKVSSFLYTDKDSDIDKIKKEEEQLKRLNIKYKRYDKLPDEMKCKYAIGVSNTKVFNVIKYLKKIKEIIINNGINVYENSCVKSIEKDNNFQCYVNNKIITAKKIVVASHYPFFLLPFMIPLKTYLERSYVSASKVKNDKSFSAITLSKSVKSIRYYGDTDKYFIYLTRNHNLCNKYNYKENFDSLLEDLDKLNIKPDYIWSNQDIMTEDNLPYIGFIDEDLLIGTGYNTWGMTNGTLAGKVLSDLIKNKHNKYKTLFDPKRNKQLNILKYPLNISYSVKSIVENKIVKNKTWYSDKVKFTKKNNKNVAIYIDENNKEHVVYNICPHLKCSLVFNEIEKTWDCPCHGSRFDIDGNCIFGPSKENISFKKEI